MRQISLNGYEDGNKNDVTLYVSNDTLQKNIDLQKKESEKLNITCLQSLYSVGLNIRKDVLKFLRSTTRLLSRHQRQPELIPQQYFHTENGRDRCSAIEMLQENVLNSLTPAVTETSSK